MDWFNKWPSEALNAVAIKQMEESPFDDELKDKIVRATEVFHTEAIELSKRFFQQTNRQNYVTPTSFLDLMNVFQSLLDKQRNFLYDKKQSYESGCTKLEEQTQEVENMQQEITEKRPKLEEFEENTRQLMEELHEKAVTEVEPKRQLIR